MDAIADAGEAVTFLLWLRCYLHGGHIFFQVGRGWQGSIPRRCALCGCLTLSPDLNRVEDV